MANHRNHSHASHHTEPKSRLRRWQKNAIHFGILLVITCAFALEGAKLADIGFFALAVATEFA